MQHSHFSTSYSPLPPSLFDGIFLSTHFKSPKQHWPVCINLSTMIWELQAACALQQAPQNNLQWPPPTLGPDQLVLNSLCLPWICSAHATPLPLLTGSCSNTGKVITGPSSQCWQVSADKPGHDDISNTYQLFNVDQVIRQVGRRTGACQTLRWAALTPPDLTSPIITAISN